MRKFGSPASRWRHLPAYALLLGLCGAIWWYSLLSRSHSAVTTPNGLSGQAYRRGPGDFLGIHAAAPAKQEELAKLKVLAVIGVQTGFTRKGSPPEYDYRLRRNALRATWFPTDQSDADRVERETGMVFRFVIGYAADSAQEEELAAEIAANGAFLRLDIQEAYLSLTRKTLVFLQHVTRMYEPQYIIKADDDVFLRTDRLPLAIAHWRKEDADYIGCMKTGGIQRNPVMRWFEPQHTVLGGDQYFTHAWGSLYVLSNRAALALASIITALPTGLRFFNNEDVTVGSWMLALNVSHYDDRRLCEPSCTESSVAVYDMPKCAGLCDAPGSLPLLFNSSECNTPVADPETGELVWREPYFWF